MPCRAVHATLCCAMLYLAMLCHDSPYCATLCRAVPCHPVGAHQHPVPFTLSCRKRLRDSTTKIHMNLLAALLLLNCSFLLSTPLATGPEWLCRVTAALLHASLLCTLAWMAAEAFHLLLLLVKVYNVYIQHYLLKLCLFSWGEWACTQPCLSMPACGAAAPAQRHTACPWAHRFARAGRGGCFCLQERYVWVPHHPHH